MTSKAKYHPLTSQVTFTVLALALFSLVMVVGFGLFAALSADRESLEKQKLFVSNGIRDEIADVIRQQESIAVWDDAIIQARAGDQTWMAENLGEWMYTYYGHDRAYVLDAADRPIHAMQDGKTLAPAAYGKDSAVISPFVQRIRSLIASSAAGWEDAGPLVVSDLVSLGNKPAIVSVQPLIPSSDRLTQLPGEEYLTLPCNSSMMMLSPGLPPNISSPTPISCRNSPLR